MAPWADTRSFPCLRALLLPYPHSSDGGPHSSSRACKGHLHHNIMPPPAAVCPRQGSCAPSEAPKTLGFPQGPVKSQRGAPGNRKEIHQVCDKLHLLGNNLCSVGSLDSKARRVGSELGKPFPQTCLSTEGPSHTA